MALQPYFGIRTRCRDFAAAPVNLFHGLRHEFRGYPMTAQLRQDDRVIDVEDAGRGLASLLPAVRRARAPAVLLARHDSHRAGCSGWEMGKDFSMEDQRFNVFVVALVAGKRYRNSE